MIFQSKNFVVIAAEKPFVSREEGGHIKVDTKFHGIKNTRKDLTVDEAFEFAFLTSIASEAMETVLVKKGIPIVRMNFLELGNWYAVDGSPEHVHVHIFGRVKDCKHQPFPQAPYLPFRSTGFYQGFIPLTAQDCQDISAEIHRLLKTEKYAGGAERYAAD